MLTTRPPVGSQVRRLVRPPIFQQMLLWQHCPLATVVRWIEGDLGMVIISHDGGQTSYGSVISRLADVTPSPGLWIREEEEP